MEQLPGYDAWKLASPPTPEEQGQRQALMSVDDRWDDPGEEYQSVDQWWHEKEQGDYKRSMFAERWTRDGTEYQVKYLGWVDEDGMSRFGDWVGDDFVDWHPVLRLEWTDEHERSCRCKECDPDRYTDV